MKFHTLIALCIIATALNATADIPSLINYQGRLTDANGDSVTGSKNFAISIYDAATGGNLLYTEDIGAVTLDDNGVYSFQFGESGTSNTLVTETLAITNVETLVYSKALENTGVVENSVSVTDGTNSWSQSVGNPEATATATASTISGFVIGATVTSSGSGYNSAPTVTITGNGTGATATATIFNGQVTSITITNAGSGYTGGATITVAPPVIPFRVGYSEGAITATYSSGPTAGRVITATYRYGTSGITGALSSGVEHWMAVSVDGAMQGARQRVLAVPFAQRANIAENGIDVSEEYISIPLETPFLMPSNGFVTVESGPDQQFSSSRSFSVANIRVAKSSNFTNTIIELRESGSIAIPNYNRSITILGRVQLVVAKGMWVYVSAPSVGAGVGRAFYTRLSK